MAEGAVAVHPAVVGVEPRMAELDVAPVGRISVAHVTQAGEVVGRGGAAILAVGQAGVVELHLASLFLEIGNRRVSGSSRVSTQARPGRL
jgi:hypothetical protein